MMNDILLFHILFIKSGFVLGLGLGLLFSEFIYLNLKLNLLVEWNNNLQQLLAITISSYKINKRTRISRRTRNRK